MKYKFNTDINAIENMLSGMFQLVSSDDSINEVTNTIAHIPEQNTGEFDTELQVQMEVTSAVYNHTHLHDIGDVIGSIDDGGSIHLDSLILETQIREMLECMYNKNGRHLSKYMIALLDSNKIQVQLLIKRGNLMPTTDIYLMEIT